MRRGAPGWIALLAGTMSLGAPVGAATDPATQLEACAARLDPARDVGVARITSRCPELRRAWQQQSGAFGLPRNWRDVGSELSADSLRELARLLRDARSPMPMTPSAASRPRAATLGAVLADWPQPDDAGLIARLLRWIRARVGVDGPMVAPQAGPDHRADAGLRAWLARVFPWIALVATVVLLAWVLHRERSAARARRTARSVAAASSGDRGRAVDAAAVPESPGVWLAALAARLAARGLLRHPAGATPREIVAATPVDAGLAPQLRLLAAVADESRYAAQPPDPTRREAALAAGRVLVESLR